MEGTFPFTLPFAGAGFGRLYAEFGRNPEATIRRAIEGRSRA